MLKQMKKFASYDVSALENPLNDAIFMSNHNICQRMCAL